VFFSTSEVYGPGIDPMDEKLADPKPNNRYGLSKLLAEKIIEYEVSEHGLSAVILRPFMVYGENEEQGDHRSAMIRFATDLEQHKQITVHTGSARGWLHISDAVDVIERSAHLDKFATINIGHPQILSTLALAEMICTELGRPYDLIETAELPGRMTLRKNPSLDRQASLLGFSPKIYLEEGVRRVCAAAVRRADAARAGFLA
jgi:nucleoside-diphosphate-sugar epimerase